MNPLWYQNLRCYHHTWTTPCLDSIMKPVMCKARDCEHNQFLSIVKYFDKGLCLTEMMETFLIPYEIHVGQLILLIVHEFSIKADNPPIPLKGSVIFLRGCMNCKRLRSRSATYHLGRFRYLYHNCFCNVNKILGLQTCKLANFGAKLFNDLPPLTIKQCHDQNHLSTLRSLSPSDLKSKNSCQTHPIGGSTSSRPGRPE